MNMLQLFQKLINATCCSNECACSAKLTDNFISKCFGRPTDFSSSSSSSKCSMILLQPFAAMQLPQYSNDYTMLAFLSSLSV